MDTRINERVVPLLAAFIACLSSFVVNGLSRALRAWRSPALTTHHDVETTTHSTGGDHALDNYRPARDQPSDSIVQLNEHEASRANSRRKSAAPQRASESRFPQLIGTSDRVVSAISAADRARVPTAAFHVGNVHADNYSVDDLGVFVSSLNVHVVSIKLLKKRRINSGCVKSFRLCVDKNDRDIVLDKSKWPDGVTVREWRVNQAKPRRNGRLLRVNANISIYS